MLINFIVRNVKKKERRLIMDNRGLSDKIIDTVRAIRKIPREQIKNPFEIQIIVVKPKD